MLALTVAWAGIPTAHAASAEVDKYPTKPVRLIGPFVPGGGTDITARAIAAKLTERWGQQVIVDNRPGAAGTIGVEITATAAPDGYTLCLISASHSVNSATNPKLPYDLTKDLQAHLSGDVAVLRRVRSPVRSGKVGTGARHVRQGQSRQAQLRFIRHRRPAAFRGRDAQLSRRRKDGARPLQGRRRGDRRRACGQHPGRVRHAAELAALTTRPAGCGRSRLPRAKRSPTAPEFPTVAEAGLPGYEVDQWYGIITSAKVPRPLVDKLAVAIAEVGEVTGDRAAFRAPKDRHPSAARPTSSARTSGAKSPSGASS